MLHAIGSKKELTQLAYYQIVSDLLESNPVQELKLYRHHIMTTRFQHCLNVSYYNYTICKFFRLDAVSAARAGLLHDLYFYDTKAYHQDASSHSHSKHHPLVALQNAQMLMPLNARETDIIVKHMWPLTKRMPLYKESFVIVLVDKYCAVLEFCIPGAIWLFRKLFRRKKAISSL